MTKEVLFCIPQVLLLCQQQYPLGPAWYWESLRTIVFGSETEAGGVGPKEESVVTESRAIWDCLVYGGSVGIMV